ncbi:MAG TPA: hypothetical protein VNJ52_14580 [Patescibacteria group bacterium]|nr:hypothetical protein [Patescibacteria group bacterium]
MSPQKPAPAAAKSTSAAASTSAATASIGRKPWIKKTPVEVVLEQRGKQAERVAAMREDLAREEHLLEQLDIACKALQGK